MNHDGVDHSQDAARMAEIERYRLLDSDSRPELTALAELAAHVCDVSYAYISMITESEQLNLATVGFESSQLPRTLSLCDVALCDSEPLVVSDISREPRFADHPSAQSGAAVFYGSFQLVTPSGVPFGSLCVFDDREHELADWQHRALQNLAERAVDVLELAARNRELASTVDELERSNLQLAAFAGQVSHDLRNPLGAVAGTLELLSDLIDGAELDVTTMRLLLARAHRSTARMGRLVEEVLEFAALGGQLDRHLVDVEKLVRDVRDDLETELSGAEVEVGVLDDVVADPVQLRIVVQNVLSNAAKYTAPGEPARIAVTARADEHTWRLELVDHGLGLAPENRTRVFDPFVRVVGAEPDRADAVPGTGMGLATCRRIVSAHGGRIELDETPGGGTTVTIELPVLPPVSDA